MKQYETKNYIFNYNENSKAEKDIEEIVKYQESCFEYICNVLRMNLDFKIEYFLYETPEEVGRVYGDNEPCNGFCDLPNKIYAVYNEEVQCIGFHEDAHIISYLINRPNSCAIREGLAMYFDRRWWGIHNLDWTAYFIKNGTYVSIDKLLEQDTFFSIDCSVTYPIMGAFTEWLISTYGNDKYIAFYKQKDSIQSFEEIYGYTINELNQMFINYVSLFKFDEILEQRMKELFTQTI